MESSERSWRIGASLVGKVLVSFWYCFTLIFIYVIVYKFFFGCFRLFYVVVVDWLVIYLFRVCIYVCSACMQDPHEKQLYCRWGICCWKLTFYLYTSGPTPQVAKTLSFRWSTANPWRWWQRNLENIDIEEWELPSPHLRCRFGFQVPD